MPSPTAIIEKGVFDFLVSMFLKNYIKIQAIHHKNDCLTCKPFSNAVIVVLYVTTDGEAPVA